MKQQLAGTRRLSSYQRLQHQPNEGAGREQQSLSHPRGPLSLDLNAFAFSCCVLGTVKDPRINKCPCHKQRPQQDPLPLASPLHVSVEVASHQSVLVFVIVPARSYTRKNEPLFHYMNKLKRLAVLSVSTHLATLSSSAPSTFPPFDVLLSLCTRALTFSVCLCVPVCVLCSWTR
eukprot:m.265745 g.265745  ORF g.265745 m.265745 type:complete len:175 (-) comp15627_c0_seq31:3928-4452(-)